MLIDFFDKVSKTWKTPSTDNGLPVQLVGSILAESKDQTDAVDGTITFSNVVDYIELYNGDETNVGTFYVNGVKIYVPPKAMTNIMGFSVATKTETVTITGATSYIVNRYE